MSGFKHCPSCGGEYQAWATWCHDCDLSLDAPAPAPDTHSDAPGETTAEIADDVRLLREAPPDWLERLADRLATEGIESWIHAGDPTCGSDHQHASSCKTQLGLWVLRADLPHAATIDSTHERIELPELAGHAPAADCCPACNTPLAPDASGCESCGLEFVA